jgi:ubiquinone/menaquinone biosynthesis C-methylase UbiE
MEAEPIVRIYESRLWRRSPWFGLALGIGFDAELEMILRAAALRESETVLDLACGPGIYTRPLARRVASGLVVGLDLSWPMLRYASARARAEGLANVLFLRGTALQIPFAPGRFDAVNCCGALHLFPDVPRVLGEVARVLSPGGRFTVATFRTRADPVARLASWLRRRLLGIDAFTPRALEARLTDAGLREVQCHHARGVWLVMSGRKPAAP